MRVIRDYQYVMAEDRGACAAIGNFDGVHLGHQSVLDLTRAEARKQDRPLGVITFEPHPREYFAPDAPPFRLMNAAARAHRLAKLGVARLYELNFNAALSALSARNFAKDVIADGLGVKHVVVGHDFCFGKGREGDVAALRSLGEEFGFGVTIAPLIEDEGGIYSSTLIREALSDGRPQDANRMLGHWHHIEGPVVTGDQRGRDLGYPTANLKIDGLHPPKFGVYAVIVQILSGPHKGCYKGAASIGNRPTFGGEVPNLEVFLFDFSGDIYGAEISVALVAFQRPELKFDTIDSLTEQIRLDCEESRRLLAGL